MKLQTTCIICPRGCRLTIDDNLIVSGNSCPRGERYGRQEATDPRRSVSSTIRIDSCLVKMCPVHTSAPFPKAKIPALMEAIKPLSVKAPVHMGEAVCQNLFGTGIDLLISEDIEK